MLLAQTGCFKNSILLIPARRAAAANRSTGGGGFFYKFYKYEHWFSELFIFLCVVKESVDITQSLQALHFYFDGNNL